MRSNYLSSAFVADWTSRSIRKVSVCCLSEGEPLTFTG